MAEKTASKDEQIAKKTASKRETGNNSTTAKATKSEKVIAKSTAAKKSLSKKRTVNVTLTKSFHGRLPSHRATVRGLGLRRINHTVTLNDTPEVRGMINKIAYLLKVES